MKPITLNRDSWHCWLATNFGAYNSYIQSRHNFCSYLPNVIFGGLSFLFLTVVGVVITIFEGFGLAYVASSIINGPFVIPDNEAYILVGTVVFVVTVLIGVVAGVCYLINIYDEWHETPSYEAEKEPGFYTLAYRSIKDKVCLSIKWE